MIPIIRKALLSDFDAIYELINELEERTFGKPTQAAIYQENLSNKNNIYLVAVFDFKVVGFASCHVQKFLHHNGKVGEIVEMVVASAYRNLKIGEQLVAQQIKLAKESGVQLLEVTSNNRRIDAHRFYQKVGFKQTHQKFTLTI